MHSAEYTTYTDKRVISIIKSMLKAGIIEDDTFQESNLGTPQGGILSPLLANVYLHSFDKTIESAYENPFNSNDYTKRYNATRRLRELGFPPVYLVRYADDWVIFTNTLSEAKSKFRWLKKYLKHKFKLELSEEKTIITDIRKSPIKFLGFCVEAEPALPILGKKFNPNHLVAKIYPNPQKVNEQITSICQQIRLIPEVQGTNQKMAHIEKINAMLVGMAEYWSKGLCKKTLGRMDNVFHQCGYFTWKRMFRKNYRKFLIPVREFTNRPNRHIKYSMQSWALAMLTLNNNSNSKH